MDDRESLLISRAESALRRPLTPEERSEIEIWDRGRTLAPIVHTEAWAILMEAVKSYSDKAIEQLVNTAPGSDNIKEAHAAAYALSNFYFMFQEDVSRAIQASMKTPSILREAYSAMPPESM